MDSDAPSRSRKYSPVPSRCEPTPPELGRIATHDRRGALDTIIQSAVVDLFHASDVAVAPVERTRVRPERVQHQELAAAMHFTGRGFNGTLTVGVPPGVFASVERAKARRLDGRDWVREVTNQVFGRLKRRLLQYHVELSAGLPSALNRDGFEREQKRAGFVVYAFRTLHGDIIVTLSGDIDHSVLAYYYASNIPSEGDVILF